MVGHFSAVEADKTEIRKNRNEIKEMLTFSDLAFICDFAKLNEEYRRKCYSWLSAEFNLWATVGGSTLKVDPREAPRFKNNSWNMLDQIQTRTERLEAKIRKIIVFQIAYKSGDVTKLKG